MAAKQYLFHPERNPLVRGDYRPAEYKISKADLFINLDEKQTEVHSRISVERNPVVATLGGPLVLDGENLKLKKLQIIENGKARDLDPQEYVVTDKNLTIKRPPAGKFQLEIVTEIDPSANTQLEGIYMAGDVLCSQCEAQGFRHITYFLDRPDNLAVFDVTLEADKAKFPVLLSNGNGDYKSSKDLGNGRHQVRWQDPWPKPSYLFATVAGDLKVLEDTFTTMSGKKVDLRVFVQPGYEDKIKWAMESTKRAMKWDEDAYGREYDLDVFHIVAVDKFNAGAMENKGLNIYNVAALVGSPESSTDSELIYIEAVLGHEYFHNWTGDRVTVRDWFELTLKEGLTVLRDREFTGDMHSNAIKTIQDAVSLRAGQFMEDSGPAAHPIRPDVVEEFRNIYSSTVYTKGSHVLGMLKTILGDNVWRMAMDSYFDKYDGMAVTCDDFVDNMQDVSGVDLTQFRRWYSQSGTPEISYVGKYDPVAKTYTLMLSQRTPATADQPQNEKQAMHIPVAVGLIGPSGKDIQLVMDGDECANGPATRVLHLTKDVQTFVFKNVNGPVVPSILRGFSAPVKITTEPSDEELIFRMMHDSDPFNKYEAAERLMIKTIHGLIRDHEDEVPFKLAQEFIDAYGVNVANALEGDLAFSEMVLGFPARSLIMQRLEHVDPDAIDAAMGFLHNELTKNFRPQFESIYDATKAPAGEAYQVVPEQVGRRALHNLMISRLALAKNEPAAGNEQDWDDKDVPEFCAHTEVQNQYVEATNMTERLSALATMSQMPDAQIAAIADKFMEEFYQEFKTNPNVVDKWLRLKAGMHDGDVLGRVKELMKHEAFDITNPNKVMAVLGGFAGSNPTVFHKKDGSGYAFMADMVIKLNDINPSTGARAVTMLTQFKRYDETRQALMLKQLERINATPKLSSSIKERVGQAIAMAKPKTPAQKFGEQAKPK